MIPTVDFETKCYENDWRIVLADGFLEKAVKDCRHTFSQCRLIINNVVDRWAVEQAAQAAIKRGAIDTYVFAEDHADKVLAAIGLTRADFGRGYVYSISELVGIFKCESDYLLYFASDSFMLPDQVAWVSSAIDLMQTHCEVLVANPVWNEKFDEAEREAVSQRAGDFWISYGFSDQCYLIRPSDFRAPIYGYTHPDVQGFPAYGGELFEKRVDNYMRTYKKVRLTHRQASYRHQNYPRVLCFK